MKIGIVLYPTFGGSGIVATELGKALAEKGHEIHFITYSQPVRLDRLRENIFFHEVRISDYPLFDHSPYEQVLTSKLVDVVKYEKLDLLHCHYAIPHASAAFMAQQILKDQGIHIPYITTLHGTDITLVGKDPSFEPVITFAINKSTVVTAVSESLRRDTFEHFEITNNIQVVPNFLCLDQYKLPHNTKYKKRYAPEGEILFTHVSNFRKVKRIPDVLEIFKKALDKGVNGKLLMVGDGPERNIAEKQCREWGICSRVLFLGSLKSTIEVLSISDIFLLPSETESFGLAALEALAAKVPVIASNTGGIPEVVEHGVSGFLSNVGDTDDMANNVMKLLESDETLANYKKNAYTQATKFDINKILPIYEDLYERAVNCVKSRMA
jgi:N-acetyl-alpha-D-glucosaminyl L-malate synthase BshA